MKRLLAFALAALFAVTVSAQITWNAKLGGGIATCYGGDTDDLKNHSVVKLGVGLEYPLSSNLSLMPSLEIATKGTETEGDFKMTLDMLYLQAPIMFAYRYNISDAWNFVVKAGPYFGYVISDDLEWTLNYQGLSTPNYETDIVKKFDAGLDVGIDFERHRFVFGLEAEMGFMNLYEGDYVKNLAFYVTLGRKF